MFINLVRVFLFVINQWTWSIAFSSALAREQALVTATPVLQTISIILEIFVANLNIALGGNTFVFNGELRLNGLSLLERGLTCIFLPKSDTFSHRVIIAISKTGESEWRNLVNLGWLWQCNFFGMYINCRYFWVRVRPKNFLSLSLSLSLCFSFVLCSPMKIGPRQAEKNEKASSLYRLSQSTIAEKMKRCVPLRRNVAEKPRGMRLKFVLSQLRTCTHENKNMFVFFKSWARVSLVQPRKTQWSQF